MNNEILEYQDKEFAHMAKTVSNLSNEWRQPISYLSSQILYLQTLQRFANEKQITQEVDKILPYLNDSIKKLHETMNLFANFYNDMESTTAFNPRQEIENLTSMFEQKMILQNINLQIFCDDDLSLNICKKSFINILLILFENAIESFEGKKISKPFTNISVTKYGNQIEVTVKSNANTLTQNHKGIIFKQPFSTKDNSSGLGLVIAKTIVTERLSGTIDYNLSNDDIEFIVKLLAKP